ncbi:hypothetical protein D9756_011062 [Leucocoprinus leucothites]|uniref:DUF6533 domain-containing protein n=1 Tax=Leucocoprinus leucothites TaxID=201217 RepID=A0A8H5CMV6_9AGAR|nr:hypothetical protein D9756_011062 [Leucoagaricus leucothites]
MSEIYIRQSCDVAGLALLLYELFLTWDQEYQCIWRNSDWFTTSSFVLSRYLALVIQIINTVYSFLLLQRPDANCFHWFIFQTYTVLILLGNLELVMMVRVFALYERKPMFGFLLTLWFFSSRGLNVWNGLESLRDMEIEPFCIPNRTPDSSKWFGLTILTNQLLLWLLTLKKYRSAKKYRWSIPPVLRRVMRDSSWILALLTGFFTLYLYITESSVAEIVLVLWSSLCIIVPADILRLRSPAFERLYERVLGFLMRESEKHSTNGVIWSILGVNFALQFYPHDVATVAILILSWADTAASTIGRLYGPSSPPSPFPFLHSSLQTTSRENPSRAEKKLHWVHCCFSHWGDDRCWIFGLDCADEV